MELRRVADGVLRAQTCSSRSPFISSCIARWQATGQLASSTSGPRSTRRTFTNTLRNSALQPRATTTSSQAPAEEKSSTTPEAEKPQSTEKTERPNLWNTRPPSARSTMTRERESQLNGGFSADSMLAAINSMTRQGNNAANKGVNTNAMNMPQNRDRTIGFDLLNSSRPPPPPPRAKLKFGPSAGRVVTVTPNVDVAKAFRTMEINCAVNKVRKEAAQQRFHERGGLKRKRLRRERWRKKFMEGFRATIVRVRQLKNQGW